MPIRYSATHICENCKKQFEWICFQHIRTKLSETPYVNDAPPANKTLAYLFEKNADGTINVAVNCPHCDYDNQFVISNTL